MDLREVGLDVGGDPTALRRDLPKARFPVVLFAVAVLVLLLMLPTGSRSTLPSELFRLVADMADEDAEGDGEKARWSRVSASGV